MNVLRTKFITKFKNHYKDKSLLIFLNFIFSIAENIGLCCMKKRGKMYISSVFFCYYSYAVIKQFFDIEYYDIINNGLNTVSDLLLLSINFVLVFACNFNRYYFATEMPFYFKKLELVVNRARDLDIGIYNKKQRVFIYLYLIILFFLYTSICLILQYISFNIDGDFVGLVILTAYSLPLLCITCNCSCFILLFFVMSSYFEFATDALYKYSNKIQMNDKMRYHIKEIISIQSDLCEIKNMFLYMTDVFNMIVLLGIMMLTVFYIYFIWDNWQMLTDQGFFMKCSFMNFLIYVQLILFAMIYTANKCSFEVNINKPVVSGI